MFKKLIPFVYIVLVWGVFSFPYFFQGKVPYPSTYQVNHFPPWNAYPELLGPVKNASMPDIIDQIYPWRYLAIEIWKTGQLPLWNPYNFAGNPLLANFQSAVLSPFNSIFFLLPFVDAWSTLVLLQPLIALIATYLFVYELSKNKIASVISAVTFSFSGFMVTWMAYGTLSFAISFLPLALFTIERFYSTKLRKYLILLSITFPLSFFAGHFQTSLYFALFIFVYILFKYITLKKFYNSLFLILYSLFGLLLTLPQIFPSIEFYLYSARSEIFNTGGGIPLNYLVTLFAPDFYGNPVTRNMFSGYHYAEWASFVGIIPFTLSLIALCFGRNKYVIFFVVTGIATLILALDTPLQNLIAFLKIPVLSTSYPTRIIVLSSFSFSLLAGFGFETLIHLLQTKRLKPVFVLFTGLFVLLLILWTLLLVFKIFPDERLTIATRNLLLPSALFLITSFVIAVCFLQKKVLQLLGIILLGLVVFDSLRFATKWIPFEEKDKVYKDLPIFNELKKQTNHSRYFGNLGAQVASYYQLQSLDGYDPLFIKRYGEFVRSIGAAGEFTPAERVVVKVPRLSPYTDRILDITSVTTIFHPRSDTYQSWAYPVWDNPERYRKEYEDEKFELYKNTQALPRVSLFYEFEVLSDDKAILKRLSDPTFDFRATIILEKNVSENTSGGTGSARIISYTPNVVTVATQTDTPALLFLADNYYPGWKAFIDGKEAAILRANYTFRAVVVPEGTHTVEFRYEPESFKFGVMGAFLGFVGIVGTSLFTRQRLKFKSKNSK